jgi:hypothetical protein
MRSLVYLGMLGATLAAASPARAQSGAASAARKPPLLTGGGAITYAQPVGDFRDNINGGGGAEGHLLVRLDQSGAVALRLDGGFLVYGNEEKRVRLSNTVGDRIQVDLNTSNNIALFGVGPQFTVPSGPVRPYVNGSVGLAYFFTQSSVEGIDDEDDLFRTTNQDDVTFAYTGGAGVYIPIAVSRSTVSLDFGARYHNNGTPEYLRKGDIRDNPDGSVTLTPVKSRADFVTYHLGVSVGF